MKHNKLIIINYHHIDNPSKDAKIKGLYTNKYHFEWQMKKLLKANYNFIVFKNVIDKSYLKDKRQSVIITFDDGCLDVYENAFPIMKKLDIKAVVYPVVGCIGKKNVIWSENSEKTPVTLMSEENIKEMHNFGIEFGSHLYNHVKSELLSDDELKFQLSESKFVLEKIINEEVLSVAYPFGSYNDKVAKIAKETGYQFGLTTQEGFNVNTDLHKMQRFSSKGTKIHHYLYFGKFLKKLKRSL